MKKSGGNSKGFIQIIIVLIVIAIVGAGAYYFGTLKTKTTSVSPTSTPVVSVQPSSNPTIKPTTDPTANWKTYTNEEMGIKFKHPSNYLITNESIRPYLNGNITWGYNSASYLDCKGDCPVINSTEKTTLGGRPATKIIGYIGSIGGNIPQSYVTYEVISGTKYFIFSMQALPFVLAKDETSKYDPYTTQKIKTDDQKIFDQILSTFQFIK